MSTDVAVDPVGVAAVTTGVVDPAAQHRRDFRLLWFGQTVSALGSHVTELALPFTALFYLHANAAQIGFLNSFRDLAGLVLTLFAGVLVDRMRRRPLMIAADFGRFAALALIPLLVLGNVLSLPVLYVIAFVTGCLTVVFNLAYPAYIGTLLRSEDLVGGNSRLEASQQVAGVVGPGLGGVLVQLLRAPFAVAVDAVSFLISAVSLVFIRHQEPAEETSRPVAKGPRGVWQDMMEGLHFTFRRSYLRALAAEAATFNLFSQIVLVLFILYANQSVGLSASQIGIIFAVGSVGGTAGALLMQRSIDRFGFGATLLGSTAATIVPMIALPFIGGPRLVQAIAFGLVYLLVGFGIVMSAIASMTLRLNVTPAPLRGRVNASFRLLSLGVIPIGAAAAGLLGQAVGVHTALYVSAIGTPLALLWLIFSPIPRLRSLSDLPQEES